MHKLGRLYRFCRKFCKAIVSSSFSRARSPMLASRACASIIGEWATAKASPLPMTSRVWTSKRRYGLYAPGYRLSHRSCFGGCATGLPHPHSREARQASRAWCARQPVGAHRRERCPGHSDALLWRPPGSARRLAQAIVGENRYHRVDPAVTARPAPSRGSAASTCSSGKAWVAPRA